MAPEINLYPEDPFYESIIGRALQWGVSAGRHIVIFTELVVIGSFFSRFVLDRQLTDLNRSILQQQAIVESYGPLEAQIREIQAQTKGVQEILNKQKRYTVFDILQQITPSDITYKQVSLSGESELLIQGKSLSNRSLSVLLESLQRHPDLKSLTVAKIQSGDERDPGIFFTLSVSYRPNLVSGASPSPSPRGAR